MRISLFSLKRREAEAGGYKRVNARHAPVFFTIIEVLCLQESLYQRFTFLLPTVLQEHIIKKHRNPSQVTVLADKQSDVQLFLTLQNLAPRLRNIPIENIMTYKTRSIGIWEEQIQSLITDDRPDFVFLFDGRPVLVVEFTKHAYTGDNGLQRFVRAARAAENSLPFVYFGPKSRTREDEIDVEGDASARNLTSDFFVGMRCLFERFNSPQIFVPWPTNESGLPATPLNDSITAWDQVFGKITSVIDSFLFDAPLYFDHSPLDLETLNDKQLSTLELADHINTRQSEVKYPLTPMLLVNGLSNLSDLYKPLKDANYFASGKPNKLISLHAINLSRIEFIQLPNGVIVNTPVSITNIIAHLSLVINSASPLIYYTGYEWRSDPHSGVLANYFYQNHHGTNPPFVVVLYPRISLNHESTVFTELSQITWPSVSALLPLYQTRYGTDASLKMGESLGSKNLFNVWSNSSKQARVFRWYASIVVLNDGLIIGTPLRQAFDDF